MNIIRNFSAASENIISRLTADALEASLPKTRAIVLDEYYKNRTPWITRWEIKSTHHFHEELRKWLEKNFPDRQALRLRISDFQSLDARAHQMLYTSRYKAFDLFGVRTSAHSKTCYAPITTPPMTLKEVHRRASVGDEDFVELHLAYCRARMALRRPARLLLSPENN
ncbi:MAG: hypothetical protein P4M15_02980 [Alphaproteobacteria bacterium]|nr:hypothetical protein [Alphaproteobacteria bacterium]